jgi:hypothetical protein
MLTLTFGPSGAVAESNARAESIVRAFVDAYNEREVDEMLALCTDDVRWLSINGDVLNVESIGAADLRKSLLSDLISSLVAHSSILTIQSSESQVSLVEEARWSSDSGSGVQCSTVVYELRGNKIRDIWYFPTHKCAAREVDSLGISE